MQMWCRLNSHTPIEYARQNLTEGSVGLIVFIRSNPVVWDPRVEKEVQSLTAHGFKVTVLAWDREERFNKFESSDGKVIHRLRLRAPYGKLVVVAYYPLFWLWVLSKLLGIRPKIIHACDLDPVFPAFIYKLLIGKTKVIFDMFDSYALLVRPRSKILSIFVLCLERFATSISDAFITVSGRQLALFEATKPKLVEIIFNSPLPMSRSNFLNQGTKHTKFRIVYAGIIGEGRGLLQLCEATKDVDDLELIIAGHVVDRNILAKINRFPHTRYVGRLNHREALRLQASADLIPVLYDPRIAINRVALPNKIFEAMMFGIPIITNLTHLLEESQCGIIVGYQDIKAIRQAIMYLKENPEIKRQLGHNGKRVFELKYNWDYMEKRLLGLYERLITERDGLL